MKKASGIKVFETLEEIADPAHTCLVVWDVHNGLVDRIFNREEFIGNVSRLSGALRGKMPVVYTLITFPEKEFRSGWSYYSMMKRFGIAEPEKLPDFLARGSKEREICSDLKPLPGDMELEKPSASIFIGTNFEYLMRNRGITTLIFTGIATEIGIESSARDASNRGFYPVIASDCVSSMDRESHERSLANMKKMFICESSENIIRAVGSR